MIKAVIVMNTQGKPCLTKLYDFQPPEKQQELIRTVYSVLCNRPESVSNFVEIESIFGLDSRLVYKHYATLYFVFVYDNAENELAMLDLIQGQKQLMQMSVLSQSLLAGGGDSVKAVEQKDLVLCLARVFRVLRYCHTVIPLQSPNSLVPVLFLDFVSFRIDGFTLQLLLTIPQRKHYTSFNN